MDRARCQARRTELRRGRPRPCAPYAGDPSLIVSLTSIAPRFGSLELVLRSLLDQTLRPQRVLVWVRANEESAVPREVRRLSDSGVFIRSLDNDLGPASKLLPTLTLHPHSTVVTADDDVVYPRTWLFDLHERAQQVPGSIACHRAHLMTFDARDRLRPYAAWKLETSEVGPDPHLFFTGHGGVLFPPGTLDRRVSDADELRLLCPTADDVWLNWMARLAGTPIVRVPRTFPRHAGVRATRTGPTLMRVNVDGGANDRQIAAMAARFGRMDPVGGVLPA